MSVALESNKVGGGPFSEGVDGAAQVSDGFGGFRQVTGSATGLQLPTHTADPATGVNGMIYYNATTHKFKGYANGSWVDLH